MKETGKTPSLKQPGESGITAAYATTFTEIKERVRSAQYAALKSVNKQLVGLYWDIGRIIVKRKTSEGWDKANCPTTGWRFAARVPWNGWFFRIQPLSDEGVSRGLSSYGKLAPLVREIAMRLRFTVYPAEPHRISTDTRKARPEEHAGATTHQPTQQVTQQVKKLLAVCIGEVSRAELMKATGLKDRVTFSKNYLDPALTGNFIEMTQPDSPKSPTQKYRLTEKGKQVLEDGI
ncbi:Fic family protein [Desulfonatronum thioautotrophicum]|uniref:Fic family protein n=1 Tax=Desulfonatronum thioautotrophicum TaxID=617001 RepID=UPI0005EBCE94|nr:DUF1016 N-terminal domain-containing protein [Desulfonatronum thioautotrophicum]